MKKKHRIIGIIVLTIIFILLISITIKNHVAQLIYNINTYLPDNLYICDINIGGKTLKEAEDMLNKLESDQLKKHITILYDDDIGYNRSTSFTYEQLGYYLDKAAIMKELNAIMDRNVNILKRIIDYRNIEKSRKEISLSFGIHYAKYMKALEVFDNVSLKSPIDAKYVVDDGKVIIVPEEPGYVYDKEGLYKELLTNSKLTTAKLNVKAVNPAITAEHLKKQGIKELISKFTTNFDAGNVPRASNIRLAAKQIDGTILAPGESFSFNEVVGERTVERGFREAGVYISGKVDTGIGGGICQVSTTLYNAVLLADLQVVERSNHSLTVPYVPLSRDAAVSWGAQDFVFKNNTDNHILIHSTTTAGSITFELYGTRSNKKVELISTTLSRLKAPVVYIDDDEALFGQETVIENGHDGYQSQLIKNIYIDGKKVHSEIVSKDRYLQAAKIIKRGTRIPDNLQALEDEN